MSTLNSPATAAAVEPASVLDRADRFADRHLGPSPQATEQMLSELGYDSLQALLTDTIPEGIRTQRPLNIGDAASEREALDTLRAMASKNQVFRSMIGMGYYDTETPPVIQRTILENPLWYTPYTPYQAEIAQGRLEALLNFQTMVSDLTGLDMANASLLDEATAAAEAMAMCFAIGRRKKTQFFVAEDCHPQTIAVLRTRAESMGIELVVGSAQTDSLDFANNNYCGILLQYPTTDGRIEDYEALAQAAHDNGAMVVVASDLLALTLLRPPGEFGADIAVGNSQRFGVPMGYGGPHAAFMATHDKHARKMPGRIVGVSKDANGENAYRLAIQTREQHIKRDRATSNICTAQVLLAVMASMYAVYHGPDGLKQIARRVRAYTQVLAAGLRRLGHAVPEEPVFDTLTVTPAGPSAEAIHKAAHQRGINLRRFEDGRVGISLDETTTRADIAELLAIFGDDQADATQADALLEGASLDYAAPHQRTSDYMTHPVFHQYRNEHELLRYITRLQEKDVSLANAMIPLGSCTMKLNAAAEMMPITWPEFAKLHPFAPKDQAAGYYEMFAELESWLSDMTGFSALSLQPNAGSQGEYSGLLTIRAYHHSRGQTQRDICLVPTSAHGTNPASAVVAGFRVAPIQCDSKGNIDIEDLKAKAAKHADELAAAMITYPSTHGVFEQTIIEACQIVHENGGQVYLDGANLNAQLGWCRPGEYGADVVHLNLHKTFCIPHGGGGPGMGPIGVAKHLAPFLPGHPLDDNCGGDQAIGPIAAAPYGSPAILPISWMYIAMMGSEGLTRATEYAILAANYMAEKIGQHYDVLYRGENNRVAHEFIVDCRAFEKSAGITVEDIAKRLIDFGLHAPTMSWPVPGTLMFEPTESESKEELDRFCEAMATIRQEIADIEEGETDAQDNPLKHSPHPPITIADDDWSHAYTRQQAAYPSAWLRERKYWPPVARIDNAYGDRHLFCACPPMEDLCE
jgi:glycine dehydrogenase